MRRRPDPPSRRPPQAAPPRPGAPASAAWRRAVVPVLVLLCGAGIGLVPLPALSAGGSGAGPSIVAAPVRVATTDDGAVAYRSIGAGTPAIVLVMGYSGSMDDWEPSFVDRLARTRRVVIFDNAGIGQTAMPAGTLTVSAMADQTAALIAALHLHRPDVLGWSMGGMIAQALAVLHPADVGHLVLAATYPGNGKGTSPSAAAVRDLADPGASGEEALLDLLFPADHRADAASYVKAITSYPDFTLAPSSVDQQQLTASADWLEGKEAAGAGISRLRMPVLVADGAEDALNPVANDRELARAIPHAQLDLYPDASHGFLFQDEPAFLARLHRFWG